MAEPLVIAIVGAESTGKTQLAQSLSARLGELTGARCTWVAEHLRQWCNDHRRTPLAHEQMAIAVQQEAAITAAALTHDIVVCDTTPLMTCIYSRKLFGDSSLDAIALRVQQRCHVTLLTALDITWVADGLQRDGPQVREGVDALLREWLGARGLGWSVVTGTGAARLDNAQAAVAHLLAPWLVPRAGLFTGLAQAAAAGRAARWSCECVDGECEHRSLALARQAAPVPSTALAAK